MPNDNANNLVSSKKEFSRTLAAADRTAVLNLASEIERDHSIELLKEPTKTLVMIRARESVRGELFNLGELLAIECLVRVDGYPGVAVLAGSDAEKCKALALLDAAHSAGLAVMEKIMPCVAKLEELRIRKLQQEAKLHAKTQVRFRIMEDRDEDE